MSNSTSLRTSIYQVIDDDNKQSSLSKTIHLLLIILIIANVTAVVLESDAIIGQMYAQQFALFELISVTIFSIEYLLRIWTCVDSEKYKNIGAINARVKYIFSVIALIDLIAILPFFLMLITSVDLRYLRLLRVMRVLKLGHYFRGFNIFLTVIQKELKSISAAILMMMFLIIIAASVMYTLEKDAQPEVFGSILHSIWWSVVTMTTVGYGDVTPVTFLGKMVATLIMLVGVGLVALPAGMLAARFGEELRERKRNLTAHIKHALSDGVIDEKEYHSLKQLADQLELKPEDLEHSIRVLKKGLREGKCPHCGK